VSLLRLAKAYPTAPARRWRLPMLTLLLGLVVGQAALQVHPLGHAGDDGEPVCEVCVVSHSAALSGTGSTHLPATEAVAAVGLPHLPPTLPAPRAAAARDPPVLTLS
jgi:hypothetical protein